MGRRPGVELVPGVGASLRGVGVFDFRPGVDDLSFCKTEISLMTRNEGGAGAARGRVQDGNQFTHDRREVSHSHKDMSEAQT